MAFIQAARVCLVRNIIVHARQKALRKVKTAMTAAANTQIEEKAETKRQQLKGEQDAETRRLEGRSDDRLAMQMELSRLDRKDDREARRDERAYQNRKLDMQEARLDRKDRQAAIQQMMAGLAQLGASIAI